MTANPIGWDTDSTRDPNYLKLKWIYDVWSLWIWCNLVWKQGKWSWSQVNWSGHHPWTGWGQTHIFWTCQGEPVVRFFRERSDFFWTSIVERLVVILKTTLSPQHMFFVVFNVILIIKLLLMLITIKICRNLSPGKGLDLHGALSSAAPAGHEGWRSRPWGLGWCWGEGGLVTLGAVLNPRSPSAWLVRTWVVDTVWTDDACYN